MNYALLQTGGLVLPPDACHQMMPHDVFHKIVVRYPYNKWRRIAMLLLELLKELFKVTFDFFAGWLRDLVLGAVAPE